MSTTPYVCRRSVKGAPGASAPQSTRSLSVGDALKGAPGAPAPQSSVSSCEEGEEEGEEVEEEKEEEEKVEEEEVEEKGAH